MTSNDPGADRQAERAVRSAVLLASVPHFVHRMNNGLMVLGAAVERESDRLEGLPPTFELAQLGARLRLLSTLAKDATAQTESVSIRTEVAGLLATLEPVLDPFLPELPRLAEGPHALVRAAPEALRQILCAFVVDLVAPVPPRMRPADVGEQELRVTLEVRERAVLEFVATVPKPHAAMVDVPPIEAAFGPRVRSWGGDLQRRADGYRLELPVEASVEPEGSRPGRGRRVLVVAQPGLEAEMIDDVLGEDGFQVETRGSLAEGEMTLFKSPPDVVLWEAGLFGSSLPTPAELSRRSAGLPYGVLTSDRGETADALLLPCPPAALTQYVLDRLRPE